MRASVSKAFILMNFAFYLQSTCGAGHSQNLYVKSVFCKANEKYVYKNYTCFAKSYSRTVSTVTIIFHYKTLWDNSVVCFSSQILVAPKFTLVQNRFRVLYKYGQIFRDVFIPVVIDWCEMMKTRNHNVIIKELLNFMELSSPGLVHDCPYNVRNFETLF